MNLLAQLYRYGDGLKRKVNGLLSDPMGTASLGATRMAEDQQGLLGLMDQAGYTPGSKSVLQRPQDTQQARNALADAAMQSYGGLLGATVWHGSPHKFDKFDSKKIGTGEGAQAYGHGLYLAESPDVAGSYAQSVKANSGELVKRGAAHGLPEDVASNLAAALQSGKKFDPVIDAARKMIDDPLASASQRAAAQRLIDNEMAAYNAWSEWSKPGQIYKVDLPDEQIAKMLDWDKPLSAQSKEVQAGLKQYLGPEWDKTWDSFQGVNAYDVLANGRNGNPTGSIEAAEKLRKAGIPGIRYLDGGSRTGGAGTSNYVVFPGNEGLLSILERNGSPIN